MANLRKTMIDQIAPALETLEDATLLELYAAVRGARPLSEPPPAPPHTPETRDVSTKPGSTIAIVWRVLQGVGRPLALRDIVDLARRENRALTRAMVSGALSRLTASGRVARKGAARSGTYQRVQG